MNELTFYVDEFESVKKCEYKENIKGCDYIYTIIKLPDKELHDLFVAYQRNNPKVTPKMTENGLMFTFYDIDVLAMDELINKSNIYREIMSKIGIINNVNFDKRKIVRKNRFKRTAISLSSVLFLSLTGFFMQKNNDQLKSTNINKIEYVNSANEDDDIDTDINNDHVNAIAYYLENETDIEENNLNTTTNEFDISNNSTHDSINADKPNKEEDYKMLRISADDWVDTDKYYVAKAYYFETITKYANMYGIDPNLVLAVATHESGIHSEQTNSSGAIGLFQIQVQGGWNWSNKTIEAYNFASSEYEQVLITEESISDVFENIKVGCMLLQNFLVKYNYNIAMAITAYNYGENYLSQVINKCSEDTGICITELNGLDNLEWLSYRYIISNGDASYLENVFKYIPDGTILEFRTISGNTIKIKYENINTYNQNIQKY